MYEWLKVRNVWTDEYIYDDNEEHMSWEEDIPEGWYKAFGRAMINELNDILVKHNFVDEYRVVQIKEKYGSIRWYSNGIPAEMTDEYYEWLNKYEALSEDTCIKCGEKSTHMTTGWIMPLCDECDETGRKES